jgi:hypothetical protein
LLLFPSSSSSTLLTTPKPKQVSGRDALVKKNVCQGRPHDPVVYTLPKNSEMVQSVDLKPVEVCVFHHPRHPHIPLSAFS